VGQLDFRQLDSLAVAKDQALGNIGSCFNKALDLSSWLLPFSEYEGADDVWIC
jgi:hypothetical protein